MWILLFVLLAGGGGAAVYFLAFANQGEDEEPSADAAVVARIDAGTVAPLPDAGGTPTVADAGTQVARIDAGGTTVDVTPDAAAERPPDDEVAVRITSDPSGATVRRGSRSLGETPLTVKIKRGKSLKLKLSHDGYRSRTVRVTTRRSSFSFDLKKIPTGTGPGTGAGTGTGNKPQSCAENPNQPKCQLE